MFLPVRVTGGKRSGAGAGAFCRMRALLYRNTPSAPEPSAACISSPDDEGERTITLKTLTGRLDIGLHVSMHGIQKNGTHWQSIGCKRFFGIQRPPRLNEDLLCSWDVAERHQHELQGLHPACRTEPMLVRFLHRKFSHSKLTMQSLHSPSIGATLSMLQASYTWLHMLYKMCELCKQS